MLVATGCGATAGTSTGVEATIAVTAAEQPAKQLRDLRQEPLPEIGAAFVDAWLRSQPKASLSPRFVKRFAGSPLKVRLIGTRLDHRAVDLISVRASRLTQEAVPSLTVGVDRLHEARARLSDARARLFGVGSIAEAQRARAIVVDRGAEVELHTWRLAYQVARTLGGPLWTPEAEGTFVRDLLADPAAALGRLEPKSPDYRALVRALATYRTLAAGPGGQQTLGRIKSYRRWLRLRGGKRDARVTRLRARLRAEGFSVGQVAEGRADVFDAELVTALAAFQRRHGLRPRGRLDRATMNALERPVAGLADDIATALKALRAEPARRDSYRVDVNIPAFELRVFDGGRVIARHRVVVGNNRRIVDADSGRAKRPNRTPTLASKIRAIVLSPAWRVPRRIKEDELDVRAQKRPEIYDDFRFYVDRQGVEWAVQLPGPRNALGLVKFVFPGGNGVFLHDTPRKRDFDRINRALSHGCVRVDNALSLARLLLARDNHRVGWPVAQELIRGLRETPLRLGRPVPVHLTYRTVGISVSGDLRFYRDIYSRLR